MVKKNKDTGGPIGPKVNPESVEKMQEVHKQIDETTQVMQGNIERALERGERLGDLEAQTGQLAESSKQFHKNVKQAEQNLWMKNMKLAIYTALVGMIVLAIIIFAIWWSFFR